MALQAADSYSKPDFGFAFEADQQTRAGFLMKTYGHLLGAVLAFVGIEAAIFSYVEVGPLVQRMVSGWNWLIVLGLFLGVSYMAERMARSATSIGMQYAGLGAYVVIQAVIFIPLLYFAQQMAAESGANIIGTAGLATLGIFGALTVVVFLTRWDFSFLRGALMIAGIGAMALIAGSILFGFELGEIFTIAMIVFAAMFVLYDTSNVMHHYRTDQHVVAALALFASLALLFWYVLRLLMYLQSFADD